MSRTNLVRPRRRAGSPHDYAMDAHFSYSRGRRLFSGTARVCDLNAEFVGFESETPPPRGTQVEMHIAWPFLLQNVCPLQLVVQGTVVETDSAGAVVRIDDYEFRTCGRFSFGQAPTAQNACSLIA